VNKRTLQFGQATCTLVEKGSFIPDTQKCRRFFVVDDEPLIASTLAMILSNSGFDAMSFSEPLEALQASQSGAAPDLLISDVMMPFLSGIELATKVQETSPNCKVLLISGHSHIADSFKSGQQRFEFLSKPIHPSDLLQKIQNMIEEAPPKPSIRGVPRKNLGLSSV
jgi:DNA-binding NtrC family response regulator